MSQNTQSSSMLRQWEILKALPQNGSGVSSKQLHVILADLGIQVSKRTIERDLISLSKVFDIECLMNSTPYGWRWAYNAVEELPEVSLTDAISLNLISDTLQPLLPASMIDVLAIKLRKAKKKLIERNETDWLSKFAQIPAGVQLKAPDLDKEILHLLQLAVIQEDQIQVQYKKLMNSTSMDLTLHPLAIVLRDGITYVIAKTNNYPDYARYAAHRFKSVKLLNKKVNRSGFNLESYLNTGAMGFGVTRPITITAKIDKVLSRLLSQTPISEHQQIKKNKSGYQLKVQVIKSWQLNWWILSKSEHIEILKPNSYREEIKNILSASLNKYLD